MSPLYLVRHVWTARALHEDQVTFYPAKLLALLLRAILKFEDLLEAKVPLRRVGLPL